MTFDDAMGLVRGLNRDQVRAYVAAELPAREAADFEERTRGSYSSEVVRIAAAQALARHKRNARPNPT